MIKLDEQLFYFKEYLETHLKISDCLDSFCTKMNDELSSFTLEELSKIKNASPIQLKSIIDELHAFNSMMEILNQSNEISPEIIRTQVITQNYISFVYLKDKCFEVTKKIAKPGTFLKKTCTYLLNDRVRAFRNSLAHGNWEYNSTYTGLIFYAHKGEITPDSTMSKFEVDTEELNFWQALSRATAYTIYTKIIQNNVNTI